MKIVYTVSLALIALLGASTTTSSAQEITAVDLGTDVLAPAETGADFELDYDAEFIGADATEGTEGEALAATTDVAEADREALPADAETTDVAEIGAEGDLPTDGTAKTEVGAEGDIVGADALAGANAGDGNAEAVTGDNAEAAAASEVGAEGDLDLATLPVVRQNVIMTVNQKRKEAGLPQVCLSSKLMDTAQAQAIYQASTNSLTVTGKDGSSPSDRGRAAGFNSTGVAELVGAGYEKADDLINAWLQSADSKGIVMGNYTHIGPGYTVYNSQQYKYYWAVDFSYGVGEACSGLVA